MNGEYSNYLIPPLAHEITQNNMKVFILRRENRQYESFKMHLMFTWKQHPILSDKTI